MADRFCRTGWAATFGARAIIRRRILSVRGWNGSDAKVTESQGLASYLTAFQGLARWNGREQLARVGLQFDAAPVARKAASTFRSGRLNFLFLGVQENQMSPSCFREIKGLEQDMHKPTRVLELPILVEYQVLSRARSNR